jgi:hypothetical protein
MTVRTFAVGGCFLAAVVALVACGDPSRRSGFKSETEANDPSKDTKGTGPGFAGDTPDGGSTCAINNANADPDADSDGDGYPLKYDCNECDPNTNNGAHDIPGNGLDEDCSGTPDDEVMECDQGLAIDGSDPMDGARAMGICKTADPKGQEWGVIEAKWVKPDGTALTTDLEGVGILEDFGVNLPQMGKTMVALSSGAARGPNQPGYENPSGHTKGYTSGTPSGYPKESPACPGVVTGSAQDGAALELRIRVPSNAKSFKYQQNFFTWEYSGYICSRYNDFYVAMMDPAPAGLADGNIAFDQDSNPISVNNSLLQVCNPGTYKGKTFTCPLGNSTLQGTGFEGHAATGWLTTQTDVVPGKEITLRFAIWDSGDGSLDSTVLIDDFSWSAEPGNGTTTLPSVPK